MIYMTKPMLAVGYLEGYVIELVYGQEIEVQRRLLHISVNMLKT